MDKDDVEKRITRDPAVLVGKPIVRGTRITVSLIMNYQSNGHTAEDLLADFPNLTREDIECAVLYSEARSGVKSV